MHIKNKLIILFFILLIVCILGIWCIFKISFFSGQGDYSGKNLDKYIEVKEYKGISVEISETYSEERRREEVWKNVLSSCLIKKYPKNILKKQYEEDYQYHVDLAKEYGYDDFQKYVADMFQCTEEEFSQYINQYAESKVKNQMVVYYVAQEENITVTDQEVEAYWKQALLEEGYTEEEFLQLYGETIQEYAEKKDFRFSILSSKVVDYVYNNANVTLI